MRLRTLALGALLLAACEPTSPRPAAAVSVAPSSASSASPRRVLFVPARHQGAALDLTASDGTGLRLVSLQARSVVSDPLAFTELRLVFDNPEERTLEGTFRVVLPAGAAVSRLAMNVDGGWQEGEVVEQRAARQVYEDFLHRKQDPALLEQTAGNEFSARVFPIPARGRKVLILSYSQRLGRHDEPFRLPLAGLPRLDQFEAEVYGGGRPLGAIREEGFQPAGDLALELIERDRAPARRSGELVVARVQAAGDASPDPLGTTLVLVDTSASRALGLEAQRRILLDLIGRLGRTDASARVTVMAFDQSAEVMADGLASAQGPEALDRLRQRGALGASDLAGALDAAAQQAGRGGARRLVVLTDGVATLGEVGGAGLRKQGAALRAAGVERLDVVAVGGLRDEGALAQLTTRLGLARDGVVAEGAQGGDALWRRLNQRTLAGVPVKVAGASWWSPRRLDGVQPGDEVLIHAEVPASEPLRISVGERELTPAVASDERPLLERSVAQARIDELLAQPTTARTREEVIRLSTQHRVLSPFTSLLVLETERDYQRFGLDRRALRDILTIHDGALSVDGRASLSGARLAPDDAPPPVVASAAPLTPAMPPALTPPPLSTHAPPPPGVTQPEPAPVAQVPSPTAEAPAPSGPVSSGPPGAVGNMWGEGELGVGSLGHGGGLGTGLGQGFGAGHGRLSGSHKSSSPRLRAGAATVSGRLPPEVVQRIVRQRFGRFRLCYESALRQNPALQGYVVLQFIIKNDGSMGATRSGGGTIQDAAMVRCLFGALQGMSFPAPEGNGSAIVTYPIQFGEGSIPAFKTPPMEERPAKATPYTGRFGDVMAKLERDAGAGLVAALDWRSQQPGDVLGLLALGQAYERLGDRGAAARAYGSLIDLFPARADLRRHAASRMEALGEGSLALAIDSLRQAREQRPDHPSSHRMLAMALLRQGRHEAAFEALAAGLRRPYPEGRFRGHARILREDLGLVAAAWIAREPDRRAEIERRRGEAGGVAEDAPSLRFVLSWETDANDVDFHIHDSKGGHAFYGRSSLPSGGELYADVTTGYGPECFTIRKPASQRLEYTLQAHYYSRGPMGVGMGVLEVIDHDGQGRLTFEERPFVVMSDHAYVDLGQVKRRAGG